MPSLGADMDKGTLLEWLVAPGDTVTKGDIVAVVDTDKSDIEVEVFETGVVAELLVEPGTEVPVGTPLAIIDTGAGAAPQPSSATPPPSSAPPPPPPPPPPPSPTPSRTQLPAEPERYTAPTTERTAGVVLSPLVRHIAEDRHVDIAHLWGTGVGGVVTRRDVEQAAAPSRVRDEGWVRASPLARRRAAAAGLDLADVVGSGPDGAVLAGDIDRLSTRAATPAVPADADRDTRMRAAIAAAMARSKREIPHYYLHSTIDLAAALTWLRSHNEQVPIQERILPAVLLLKATARAAAEFPALNGQWLDGHRPSPSVHLGVAISMRGGGLVAPGIADADRMALAELMAALRDLTKRARSGRVRQSEWNGPTITVTSLGDLGVDAVFGVINPPQLAMVGFGAIHDAVVAVGGQPAVRPVVIASLAADHRSSDGMQGAAFLAAVAARLQDPETL